MVKRTSFSDIKVFMLGWEFPPFISGGLGTACYGLTKAMDRIGLNVSFVLPKMVDRQYVTHVNLLTPQIKQIKQKKVVTCHEEEEEFKNVKFHSISTTLEPYMTPEEYQQKIENIIKTKKQVFFDDYVEQEDDSLEDADSKGDYCGDMHSEIARYARVAYELSGQEEFDLVHAHDWMTFPAGIAVSRMTGKPLVIHVHSTEFDRSGEHVNQMIYDIERQGMHYAKKIIAVSHFTRNIIISRYGISGDKVEVVHNGVELSKRNKFVLNDQVIRKNEKIVLFLGRITMQKGPEYFLQAAKKLLGVMDDVKFVMAGSGDLMQKSVSMAAELGIGHKVIFTGFLRGDDVKKVYKMADLFVMPSVSEPFGLVPLEALNHEVPVIISRQSGVSEVLSHALKVNFWDVDEMANKMAAVLKYPPLGITLRHHGNFEVRKLRWSDSARKCAKIYAETLTS